MRKVKSSRVTTEGEGRAAFPPRFASQSPGLTPDAALEAGFADKPHQIEQDVQRALLAQPSLHFSSLVVRRIDNGVCLQGVLEVGDETPDVCSIAQRVAGVRQVLNRLVMAPRRELPAKG